MVYPQEHPDFNYSQLTRVKSFQTGKLSFPLDSKEVDGFVWGKKEVARGFDTLSPFSPFKVPHTSLIDLREDSVVPEAQVQEIS